MSLLSSRGNKGDKKKSTPKNNNQSKFIANKSVKGGSGFVKKGMTGGSQRGS